MGSDEDVVVDPSPALRRMTTGIGVISFQMFFFAGFAFVAAAAFGLVAKRYTLKDYYRKA